MILVMEISHFIHKASLCVWMCIYNTQFMIKCIFMYSPVANKIYTIHDGKVG